MKVVNFPPINFYLIPSAWVTRPFDPQSFVFVMCWLKWGFSIERLPQ